MNAYVIERKIDFTKFDQLPTQSIDNFMTAIMFSRLQLKYMRIPIRQNFVETEDDLIQLGQK